MLLIPYTKFTLNIYRPLAQVEAELAARVKSRSLIRMKWVFSKIDPATPFEGTVANGRFNINRIINYKNSFLPIVVGELNDELDVTRVDVTMRLHYAMVVVVVALFIVFGITFGIGGTQNVDGFSPILIIVAVFSPIYLLMMIFFNMETNKARLFLEQTWQVGGPPV